MKCLIEIAKEVGKELKVGALVMLFVLSIGLIVVVPLVLMAICLPGWVWFTAMALALFGEAVAKGVANASASTEQEVGK